MDSRVEVVHSLERCVVDADSVFEAAPEQLELKQQLFAEVERAAPPDAILASNTSVIPIGLIMSRVERGNARSARTGGTRHRSCLWSKSCARRRLRTRAVAATIDAVKERRQGAGRRKKGCPGIRGQSAAACALARGDRSRRRRGLRRKTVDDVVKSSFGARLAVLGPLENADLVGTELTRSIHSYVLPALDRSTTPSPYLDRLIGEGRLGFKSGEGFRKWTPAQQAALRERVTKHLKGASARRSRSGSEAGFGGEQIGQGHHHVRGDGRHSYADDVGRPAVHARRDCGAVHRCRGSGRRHPASARARSADGRRPRSRQCSCSSCRASSRRPTR